jgi:hypothetical protein
MLRPLPELPSRWSGRGGLGLARACRPPLMVSRMSRFPRSDHARAAGIVRAGSPHHSRRGLAPLVLGRSESLVELSQLLPPPRGVRPSEHSPSGGGVCCVSLSWRRCDFRTTNSLCLLFKGDVEEASGLPDLLVGSGSSVSGMSRKWQAAMAVLYAAHGKQGWPGVVLPVG